MKFARRAEGIKSGRMIFKKAREDTRTRHHVYVTAALMEYYCSKVSPEIKYKGRIISFMWDKLIKRKAVLVSVIKL